MHPVKIITCIATLFFYVNAAAQLTYLGEDEIKNKQDGYASGKKTAGMVTLNGKYYFGIQPYRSNGKLFSRSK